MTATESSSPQSTRSAPIGTLMLLALTAIFRVWLMIILTGPQAGSAESSMEQAIESVFVTLLLWGALALLLFAGGLMGEMPRWAAILA